MVKQHLRNLAEKIGTDHYKPWKNEPFDPDLATKRNKRWNKDKMRENREIIDIGPDVRRRFEDSRSDFYELERKALREKGYQRYEKVFERRGKTGGVPGMD